MKIHLFTVSFGIFILLGQMAIKGQTNKFLLFAEKGVYQGQTDTNGLAFKLVIENPENNKKGETHCIVSVKSQSATKFYCWHYHYSATWLKIILYDSKGHPVEKTEVGKQFGNSLNVHQLYNMVKERYQQWKSGRARMTGFWPIVTSLDWFPFANFNLTELFKLKYPGEYTLHIQMPLIERAGNDEADPQLKIIWLPEVVAKIQVRLENTSQS